MGRRRSRVARPVGRSAVGCRLGTSGPAGPIDDRHRLASHRESEPGSRHVHLALRDAVRLPRQGTPRRDLPIGREAARALRSPRGVSSTSSNRTTNEPSVEATARQDTMRGGTFAITVTCSPGRKLEPETVSGCNVTCSLGRRFTAASSTSSRYRELGRERAPRMRRCEGVGARPRGIRELCGTPEREPHRADADQVA